MRPDHDILAPLAASLSLLPWQADAIAAHLRSRLPRGLAAVAPALTLQVLRAFPGGVAPDAGRLLVALRQMPQAARIIAHARRHDLQPALPLDPPQVRPDPALADLAVPLLATPGDLADFLDLSPDQLVRFADLRGLSARSTDVFGPHYLCHIRPKRSGGLRLIEEPRPFLKRLQRRLLTGILDHIPPHPAAHGFRKGRNCLGAAARHAGEELVVVFDLADFFPSIGFARIYSLFRSIGYPAEVARLLAGLTTAITPPGAHSGLVTADPGHARGPLTGRHLPQGAPTSPALANLAAFRLDARLFGLARSLDAAYTRYADDLAFSGDARIAGPLLRALPEIAADEGFRLNPAKTRVQPRHRRQIVTGLVVNAGVNLPRGDFDRLKATLHRLSDPADPRRADPAFLAALSGRISWAEAANPARGQRLRRAFQALLAPSHSD